MKKFSLIIILAIIFDSCTNRKQESMDSSSGMLKKSMIWFDANEINSNKPLSVGFRKEINIEDIPQKAEMMIFADSRYLLWVNGKYVDRGPCRFDPKGPMYDIINIKDYLLNGKNIIAFLVQGNVAAGINLKVMKHYPGLTAQINIDDQQIATDSTWLCSDQIPQQILTTRWTWSCILDNVDANSLDYNWQMPHFNDSLWKPSVPVSGDSWGTFSKRAIPLLRETDLGSGTILQIRNSKAIDTIPKKLRDNLPSKFNAGDEIVIDIGKLSLIYWTMEMNSIKGTELVFTPFQDFVKGEGKVNYNCIASFKARDGDQSYMSTDTYGFRYLKIEVKGGPFTLNDIHFFSRLYPNIRIAKFECNDNFLNKTWDQSSNTSEVLCEDGYVDSAERSEWMGDAGMVQYPVGRMVISGPANSNDSIIYSDPRLLRNMLIHIAQSQLEDGRLKAHHPSDRYDHHWFIEDYSCLWIQALRQYYENTADIGLVKELWPALQKQMDWFLNKKNFSGLYTAREFFIHLDNPLRYQECQGATINAFIFKALDDASYLAKRMHKNLESDNYRKEASSLKKIFNQLMWCDTTGSFYSALYYPEFSKDSKLDELKLMSIKDPASERPEWANGVSQWVEKGKKVQPTVQAALVALNRGIVSEDHFEDVKKYLLDHYSDLKNPYSHMMLFDELYKFDQDSLDTKVLDIIRTRWKSMVNRVSPGTSTEAFETKGYLCHPFGLVPAYSLPSYVLGVRKPEPVWEKTILIEPRLGNLTSVKGVGLTEFGPVPVEWQKDGGNFLKFSFKIPKNIKAIIRLPKLGEENQIILNGQPIDFAIKGRFLEFQVKSGEFNGEISKI